MCRCGVWRYGLNARVGVGGLVGKLSGHVGVRMSIWACASAFGWVGGWVCTS